MKITITGKNFRTYGKLNETIEKKLGKLDKYFGDDITGTVVLSHERGKDKIEITLNAKGTLFRAEELTDDIYEGIDLAVDKLANQITKFRGKLRKRYNDNKALKFEFMEEQEIDEEEPETTVVREKSFDLRPMDVEEAILEMEMLEHDFFVFMNADTDSVAVVYKRKGGKYGLLEPRY
ncbi:MAG: ribosome-associated translation inhibitor RaiA [Eubacteriales bacterium]|nr:ribosome-associated translation inhibitor RaiA [Eubacteriales bacterium]